MANKIFYKTFFIIIWLMIIQSLLYSNVIEIDVNEPYANGEMWITNIKEDIGTLHVWSNDTIVFSNGTKLTVMDFHVINHPTSALSRSLCFVIADTTSTPFFKYSDDIYKSYEIFNFQDPDTQCCHSSRLYDTLWDEALHFPDSCAGFDSVMIFENTGISDTVIPIGYSWSRILFWKGYPSFYPDNFGPSVSFSAIFYIKTKHTHLKLQVDDFTIDSSTTSMWGKNKHLGIFHFRWAADSSGNGVFKHEQVNVTQSYFKSKTNCIGKMIKNNFHFNSDITQAEIKIFSLRGSCVKREIVKDQRIFSPRHLPPGLYCMQIIANNGKSIFPIVIK